MWITERNALFIKNFNEAAVGASRTHNSKYVAFWLPFECEYRFERFQFDTGHITWDSYEIIHGGKYTYKFIIDRSDPVPIPVPDGTKVVWTMSRPST